MIEPSGCALPSRSQKIATGSGLAMYDDRPDPVVLR